YAGGSGTASGNTIGFSGGSPGRIGIYATNNAAPTVSGNTHPHLQHRPAASGRRLSHSRRVPCSPRPMRPRLSEVSPLSPMYEYSTLPSAPNEKIIAAGVAKSKGRARERNRRDALPVLQPR